METLRQSPRESPPLLRRQILEPVDDRNQDIVRYDEISPLERLALVSGWRSGTVVNVTWGFFDESGEFGSGQQLCRLTIGGFYAPWVKVKALCEKWRDALAVDGLGAFHMKEIVSDEHNYSSWPKDRQDLLNRYVDILCEHAACFGAFCYDTKNANRAFRDTYRPALIRAMMIGNSLCRDTGERGRVVFAQTNEIKQELIGRFFDRLGFGDYLDGWSVERAACSPALQAAEIVARGMRRLMQDGGVTWSFWRLLTVGAEESFWPYAPLEALAARGISPHYLFER
jgi:hypothetical protein